MRGISHFTGEHDVTGWQHKLHFHGILTNTHEHIFIHNEINIQVTGD